MTYEYKCYGCEKTFEIEQRITDLKIEKCIECGSSDFVRLISQSTFTLSGTGWYKDGYSKPKAQNV